MPLSLITGVKTYTFSRAGGILLPSFFYYISFFPQKRKISYHWEKTGRFSYRILRLWYSNAKIPNFPKAHTSDRLHHTRTTAQLKSWTWPNYESTQCIVLLKNILEWVGATCKERLVTVLLQASWRRPWKERLNYLCVSKPEPSPFLPPSAASRHHLLKTTPQN